MWFCCKDRRCKATISVRKDTNELVGETLPQHNHGNGLMMTKLKTIEKEVIEKYGAVNQLESFNMTFKNMAGKKPNVWSKLSLVKSQEADTRRSFLSNAVGKDLCDNTGRRQKTKDSKERIKWLIDHFSSTPDQEYILTMAHEIMKN